MAESFELDPVEWVTAGAVGEPGERTFYIQAQAQDLLVAIVVEKEQVRVLAQLAQELLARAGATVMPDDLDTAAQQLREPVVAVWRAGQLGLGMAPDGERFLLEAAELVEEGEEPATARLWMTREQLTSMAAHAAYSVEAGARPRCRFCDRPLDEGRDHICPAMNGHGPLST